MDKTCSNSLDLITKQVNMQKIKYLTLALLLTSSQLLSANELSKTTVAKIFIEKNNIELQELKVKVYKDFRDLSLASSNIGLASYSMLEVVEENSFLNGLKILSREDLSKVSIYTLSCDAMPPTIYPHTTFYGPCFYIKNENKIKKWNTLMLLPTKKLNKFADGRFLKGKERIYLGEWVNRLETTGHGVFTDLYFARTIHKAQSNTLLYDSTISKKMAKHISGNKFKPEEAFNGYFVEERDSNGFYYIGSLNVLAENESIQKREKMRGEKLTNETAFFDKELNYYKKGQTVSLNDYTLEGVSASGFTYYNNSKHIVRDNLHLYYLFFSYRRGHVKSVKNVEDIYKLDIDLTEYAVSSIEPLMVSKQGKVFQVFVSKLDKSYATYLREINEEK
jgi:hypothetical protein